MARAVGYAPVGQRLFDSKPGGYTQNHTVLGALSLRGLREVMMVQGGTTIEVFTLFAEKILLPELDVGTVVVLDNLAAHKSKTVVELFGDHGVHLLYTPPYSPQYNPIEWAWSKVKTFMRQAAARSLEELENVLVRAVDLITPQDALNMILGCDYLMPETIP